MTPAPGKLFSGKKIMIAATGKLFRDLLVVTAKESGAMAIVEGSGLEMMKQLEVFKPDLIFCEHDMPDLDGSAFARQLRHDHNSKTPLVMMVSQFDGDTQARSRAAGATEIMAIPFSVADILSLSKRLLSNQESGVRKLRFGPRE